MKRIFLIISLVVSIHAAVFSQPSDTAVIRNIFTEALTNYSAYDNLRHLCKEIGGRIGGSPQSLRTAAWAKEVLMENGADTVYFLEHTVRNWKRGSKEAAKIVKSSSGKHVLSVCALGGSVGTGKKGITARVIEVQNFDELKKLGKEKVNGKIVFFNRPASPATYSTFPAYGGAANQRVHGASQAALYGGIASVSRSLTLADHDYAHTGIMRYTDSLSKVPAFAISTKSADLLSKLLKTDPKLELFLQSACFEKEDTASCSVIGELRGSEYPDEIIVVGAHIDAWDNGEGAHDDGAGVVQAMEVLRIFKSLGIKLNHTLRVVEFMDEEMAQRGARKYAETALSSGEKHIAAIESDVGGFTPQGFCYDAGDEVTKRLDEWKPLLLEYGLWLYIQGHSAVDISFLEGNDIPLFGLMTDSQRYFDYQHAPSDVFEAVNKRELQLGAASMAALIFLIDKYGF
ncbi:MAG TPA: M20/M25/M40 family metallo-hydrolase [Bacteroidales bacterium]|nr:M20/M25/M40 family metallo-hydrolase [Bacteroidales bacterium]HPB26189.1 M20/M25/M40 family metallo-hydrolase [Bacteroidales bacterium]HPI31429.1 M20/M25/M40 family metallo-hydrolase [Bacteroidales bacterium]HQN16996.1 M20/M25/M40 family metallo-hydrolase [Bacteroidales bacterium]HQP16522.1 M20/M25/M40 family metallo-hydrolase [Bacteroidales bacterium]